MALLKSRKTGIGMTSARTRDRMLNRLREKGIADEVVLSAIGDIPRHIFVDEAIDSRAYEDVSLPIGFGQTISQPHTVAMMTEILRNKKPLGKVLEIGTGCGYQTAVLSKLAEEIISLERIRPLLMKAMAHLQALKCTNVKLDHADGSIGLESHAPFDGIIVTAAANHIPEALKNQLTIGGRLIIPVGTDNQMLHVIDRTETGFNETQVSEVTFVPLLPNTES